MNNYLRIRLNKHRNAMNRQARIHKRREWTTAIVFLTLGLVIGSAVSGAVWANYYQEVVK